MNKKAPLKRAPLKKSINSVDLEKLNDFASGASRDLVSSPPPVAEEAPLIEVEEKPTPSPAYPWEDPKVRADVKKAVNLALPEPMYLKLKFVSQKARISQQKIIRKALASALKRELKKLIED